MQHKRKFRFPAAPQAYAVHPGSTVAQGAHFICVAPGVLGRMAGKGLSSGTVVSGGERHASLTSWNSSRVWTPGWTWERQQTPHYWDFQGTLNTGPQRRSVPMARWWQEGKMALRSQGPWEESGTPGWGSGWSNLHSATSPCTAMASVTICPTREEDNERAVEALKPWLISSMCSHLLPGVQPSDFWPITLIHQAKMVQLHGSVVTNPSIQGGVKVSRTSTSLLKAHLPQALGPADSMWQLQCCSFKCNVMCFPLWSSPGLLCYPHYKTLKLNWGTKTRSTWKMNSASLHPKCKLGISSRKQEKFISTPLSVLVNLKSVILEIIFHFYVKN